jgi:hypothetical protein
LAGRRVNYGQEKRVKELARKKKNEEKLKRRQHKSATAEPEKAIDPAEETS